MPLKFFSALFCVIISASVFAQGGAATGGSIGVSFTALPQSSFKDTVGKFGYTALDISARIPLFGSKHQTAGRKKGAHLADSSRHFYETSARLGFGLLPIDIGFLNTTRNFYNSSAGVGVSIGSGKNIFSISANVGVAADGTVLQNNDTRYRFSGSFIVNHISQSGTVFQYGVAFTYAYGRPLPLPVLGMYKRISLGNKWSLSGVLPLSVQVTDHIDSKRQLAFSLRPSGNRFQFANENVFATTSPAVFMQLRQFQLAAVYTYKFSQYFSLGADAGLLFARKLKFTEQDDTKTILSQITIKPGPSFKISLRYSLPHKRPGIPENEAMNNY
ncbi:hypothetical protein F5148DRAFT_1287109 [Russula earlei]|uniref:Uncharacterized protein n=1 Tax=Russula earlei TaxID=71964 RepID=A0ACC0U2L7_9AGAM|nr:hypothetical protein F5148DRAFT_1287109 [Russula earlei]